MYIRPTQQTIKITSSPYLIVVAVVVVLQCSVFSLSLSSSAAHEDNKQPVFKADLDYIEMRALLETQRETVGSLGTIPF